MNKLLLHLAILCILSIIATSCERPLISAQTEFITRQSLASYQIGTPDPHLNHPVLGQRLMVKWNLPDNYMNYQDLHLETIVRFYNGTEQTYNFPITKTSGLHTLTVSAQTFCQTNGIVSYKINLIGDGCILSEWRHQLWVEIIKVEHDTDTDESGDNAEE